MYSVRRREARGVAERRWPGYMKGDILLDFSGYIMAFHIKDHATDAAVRRLARLKGKTLTETVREAVEHEYAREAAQVPLVDRLRPVQERFAALRRPGGLPADKAFFDELSDNA
jgi:antitoxin VapB